MSSHTSTSYLYISYFTNLCNDIKIFCFIHELVKHVRFLIFIMDYRQLVNYVHDEILGKTHYMVIQRLLSGLFIQDNNSRKSKFTLLTPCLYN